MYWWHWVKIAQYSLLRPVSTMKSLFSFIVGCISLQFVDCNRSFFTLLHQKSDKKELKKRLQHRFFHVNIAKFLRTAILKNTCKGLLLNIQKSNRERIKCYRSKLQSREVALTKMSSNKKSGNSLSDRMKQLVKREDFLKTSERPCKENWKRWQKIRIPYKHCLITWSFINTDNELLEKEPHQIRLFVIHFDVFQSSFTKSDLSRCFSDC